MSSGARALWPVILLSAGFMGLSGCGQDHGYVYQSKMVTIEDSLGNRPDFELSKQSYKDAVWYMPCDSRDVPPAAQPGQIVISGPSFDSVRENFGGTKMIFQGKVCPPETNSRDVVFVIDVSTSMGYTTVDQPVNGSCRRLANLEAMLDAMPSGATYGVVTFEETVVAASTKLHDTKSALYAELTQNGTKPIGDVICRWDGRSYFDNAIAKARDLLTAGRGGKIQKDIILMSDGDAEEADVNNPNSHHSKGLGMANQLKTVGVNVGGANIKVLIAALRADLPQFDKFLFHAVSPDLRGAGMIADMSQGADIGSRINAFSQGFLSAANITYGPQGSTNRIMIDLKPMLSADFSFRIENGPLVLDRDQIGYEAKIESTDTRGNKITKVSKLNWVQ